MKKVDIIITCYNKGKYVAEAIESALHQTYENIEIIIVNDASTDNSSDTISKYAQKYKNILFFDEKKNLGVVAARNLAIEAGNGDYIMPLDADDIIEPTYIEKAVKVLDANADIGIVYCRAKYIGIKNEEWLLPKYNEYDFLHNNCIFCSALFRKSDFIKAGKYKEYMQNHPEDWDLWLSILELGLIPYQIDEILFNYRQCEDDTRSNSTQNHFFETVKIVIKKHIDLYLNNTKFLEKIFKNYETEIVQKNYNIVLSEKTKLESKYKKYKKLFNIFLGISIAELILLTGTVIFHFIYINIS